MDFTRNPGSTGDSCNSRMMMRKQRVADKLDVSVSTLDRLRVEDPTFPKAVRLGPQAIAWFVDEVDDWLMDRPRVQRGTTA